MQLTRSLRMSGSRERSPLRKTEGYKMTWPRWPEKTRYETRQRFFMNLLFLLSIKLLNTFSPNAKGLNVNRVAPWGQLCLSALAKVVLTVQPRRGLISAATSSFSVWTWTSFLVGWFARLFACVFGHRVTCSPSWPPTPCVAKESDPDALLWPPKCGNGRCVCHQAWRHLVFAAREHGFCWVGQDTAPVLGTSLCIKDREHYLVLTSILSETDVSVSRRRDILNGRNCKVLFVLVYYRIMLWRLMISVMYKNYFEYYSISTIL